MHHLETLIQAIPPAVFAAGGATLVENVQDPPLLKPWKPTSCNVAASIWIVYFFPYFKTPLWKVTMAVLSLTMTGKKWKSYPPIFVS